MDPAVTAAPQEPGFLEDAKVFGDRGEGHRVGLGETGDALIATGEMGEDAAPGGVGQSGKSAIQGLRRIFNHLVKY